MQSLILRSFREYITAHHGAAVWSYVALDCGLSDGPRKNLLREDALLALVFQSAAEYSGIARPVLLEHFGEWAMPVMFEFLRPAIDSRWRTLDYLEQLPLLLMRPLLLPSREAAPFPDVAFRRIAEGQLVVEYAGPLGGCSLGIGFARGAAHMYGEPISIRQPACTLAGARVCELRLSVAPRFDETLTADRP